MGEVADMPQKRALTAAFLDAWSATQQLWLASRQGAMPHQIAGPLAAAHAAMERAVTEAEKAGAVVVERDGGRVVAIRPARESSPNTNSDMGE